MGVPTCKGLDDTPRKATPFLPLGAPLCWDPCAALLHGGTSWGCEDGGSGPRGGCGGCSRRSHCLVSLCGRIVFSPPPPGSRGTPAWPH